MATAMPISGRTSAGGQSTLEGPGSSRPWHGQWPGQAFSTLLSGIMERQLPSLEGRMQGSEDTARPGTLSLNGCPACPSDSTDSNLDSLFPLLSSLSQMMESHPSEFSSLFHTSHILSLCQVLLIFLPPTYHTCASFYLSPVPAPLDRATHPQPRQWLRPPLYLTLSPSSSWWGQLSVGGFPLSSLQSCSPTWPPGLQGGSASGPYLGPLSLLSVLRLTAFFQFLECALLLPCNPPTPSPICPGPFPPPSSSFNSCLSLESSAQTSLY